MKPKVSVIVPMLNEEKHIRACLESLINGSYGRSNIEILVYDGGSTDRSVEIVSSLQLIWPEIILLPNPKKIQVSALNLGIKKALGDIIIRADAHCQYQNDYIDVCVYYLVNLEADNVGGMQVPTGQGYISQAIASALSSPLGNGNAAYRTAKKKTYTDTVFLGAWWKHTLYQVGGFNENLVVNEDYELNQRLRKAGMRILYTPELRTKYFVRQNFAALAKQYFKYGQWRYQTAANHSTPLQPRQLVVPLATSGMLISLLALLKWRRPYLGLPLLSYLLICAWFSIFPSPQRYNVKFFPLTFLAFPLIHFSWSAGFLSSAISLANNDAPETIDGSSNTT